jgi:hypothetical protein
MRAHIHFSRFSIELEQEDIKALWEQMDQVGELFDDKCCGICGNTNIFPRVRKVGEGNRSFSYYELTCKDVKCRARLSYGQHSEGGTIFPKRHIDAEGNEVDKTVYPKTRGWHKWSKKGDEEKAGGQPSGKSAVKGKNDTTF